MQAIVGFCLCFLVMFLFSEHRPSVRWRTVAGGIVLQIGLAVLLIRVGPARDAIAMLNHGADALQRATDQGTAFLFGYLGGGVLPFVETSPGGAFILAFKILPLVLVISALSALLFYWRVLQTIAAAFAWLLRRTLGLSGPLAIAAAVHVFVGMIEAPLLIRPYLRSLSRGETFAMMTCGMAGVAGTVMVIYGTVLAPVVPNALGTIIVASVVSTPAALAIAALLIPFSPSGSSGEASLVTEEPATGAFDAVVRGTAAGVTPLVGIMTSLLVTVTLVALVNAAIGSLLSGASLQSILAWPLRPLMWLIGIPWAQTSAAASLLASKTILNEFVAHLAMAGSGGALLDQHSRVIMTFALCGFANLGSVGILVGGLASMVPERRAEFAELGLKSLLSGTVATCSSGALAALIAA